MRSCWKPLKESPGSAEVNYGPFSNFVNSQTTGIWAVIPARGGSKGIPRKNVRPLGGRPLIEYSIEVARRVPDIDRVIVTTDCAEIADVSVRAGAEVPFLRPAELATDAANMTDALYYTIDRLGEEEGRLPERLVILYPTNPFRTPELVSAVIARTARVLQALTCVSSKLQPARLLEQSGGRWVPLGDEGPMRTLRPVGVVVAHHFVPRQERSAEAFPAWRQRLRDAGIEFATEGVPLPDPYMAVDIDTPDDLALAEEILRRGLFHHELHAHHRVA